MTDTRPTPGDPPDYPGETDQPTRNDAGGEDAGAEIGSSAPSEANSAGEAETRDVEPDRASSESSPDADEHSQADDDGSQRAPAAVDAGDGEARTTADAQAETDTQETVQQSAPAPPPPPLGSATSRPVHGAAARPGLSTPGHRPAPGSQSGSLGTALISAESAPTEEFAVTEDSASAEEKSGRKGRVALIVAVAVVAVLGISYGVLYLVAGDKLARNASVAGIDVGGLTPAEAETTLETQLPGIVDDPIRLHLGDTEAMFDIVPSEAGLAIDIPATVASIPGGTANPVSLVQALFGGEDVDPIPAVDDDALHGALNAIAERSDTEPQDGTVGFDDGEVVTSDPVTGRSLDVDGAAEVVSSAFFGDEARDLPIGELTVPVHEVEPHVTEESIEQAVNEFADPAMSGPVTVVAGDRHVDIPPAIIGESLTLTPNQNGTLQPELDGEKLAELARDLLTQIGQEGQNATIRIENGQPTVIPAQAGQGIDTSSLGSAVLLALTEEGDARRAEVELTEVEPERTTEMMEELGVKEVVSEFTTNFPPAQYRDVNIGRAAELIDNTLLLPGDEFSLNGIVGERTEANGFTSGTIINQGRLEDAMGGGVSQVATTTFHAAYKAGLEDVEHWPHSIYFDRYPVGQEATVAWGAKDMRFRNDTPYGVLVETRFTPSAGRNQGTITVRIWSTEYYRVETSVSDRTNYTSPQTIYDTSSDCQPQSGSQGFSITSYRKVWTLDGELVKDESDPWTYNPNHRVVCGPDPDGDDDDD